jgi:hypothetical protein
LAVPEYYRVFVPSPLPLYERAEFALCCELNARPSSSGILRHCPLAFRDGLRPAAPERMGTCTSSVRNATLIAPFRRMMPASMAPYETPRKPLSRSGPITAILSITLVAGTLDIGENIIFNAFRHVTPYMIFQYIASGLVGMKSFDAGIASVVLGVAIHYAIALTWTIVFFAASRKLEILIRRPVICGLLYGGVVYMIMNFVVLPLTRVPHAEKAMTLASRINGVAALLFCIGLTIALLVRRHAERTAQHAQS